MKHRIKRAFSWAGGKTQLLDVIIPLMPQDYNNYIEPFIGGGSVFLAVQPEKAILNDLNINIFNVFNVFKDKKEQLYQAMEEHTKKHNEQKQEYFKCVSSLKERNLNDIQMASRFLYLMKTCWGGIWRFDVNGDFNCSITKDMFIEHKIYKSFYDETIINEISNYLNNNQIELFNKDFEKIINQAQQGDFIFVDPPYHCSKVQYNKIVFKDEEHLRLGKALKEADKRGVKWLLCQNNTALMHGIYQDFKILQYYTNRPQSPDIKKRIGGGAELIALNYELRLEQLQIFQKLQEARDEKRKEYLKKVS